MNTRWSGRVSREHGFVGGELINALMIVAAVALYVSVSIPLAQRLSARWIGAVWLPLIPPALVYLGGFVAALISPYDSPEFKEPFWRRGLYFGNLAFMSLVFWTIPVLLLYLGVRWLIRLL